jgi:hypothetical protein
MDALAEACRAKLAEGKMAPDGELALTMDQLDPHWRETVEQRNERLRKSGVIMCGKQPATHADMDAVESFAQFLRDKAEGDDHDRAPGDRGNGPAGR